MSSIVASPAAGLKVGIVSLGCAKNLVDSEIIAGHLREAGLSLTPDANAADVMIVNTCSFIDAAKEESIAAILESNRNRGMSRRHMTRKSSSSPAAWRSASQGTARLAARSGRLHRPRPAHADRPDHRGAD